MNRTDFQQLADVRIAEAAALLALATPMSDGAYYLAGYAVECALKSCISKSYAPEQWPEKGFVADCHTHEISKLLRLAKLEAVMTADIMANPNLGINWTIVKDWSEHSRYERHGLTKAQRLYDAIADAKDGVLTWLKMYW
ncbi:MAG TPA: hypothetical protein VF278_19825 [Pirellulales bacterium]